MRKLLFSIVLFVFIFHLSTSLVNASFGISPADLTFRNLMPGGVYKKIYLLSRTDLTKDDTVFVEIDIEGANDWIHIEPGLSFTIAKGERTKKMSVTISVPDDALLKSYEGFITLKVKNEDREGGISVVKGVAISVNLVTTQSEDAKLLIRKIQIPDVYQGEQVEAIVVAENRGNVSISPEQVDITVFDSGGELFSSKKFSNIPQINPTDTKEYTLLIEDDFSLGEYNAEILVKYKGEVIREESLVFMVAEKLQEVGTKSKTNSNILFFVGLLLIMIPFLFVLRKFLRIILARN